MRRRPTNANRPMRRQLLRRRHHRAFNTRNTIRPRPRPPTSIRYTLNVRLPTTTMMRHPTRRASRRGRRGVLPRHHARNIPITIGGRLCRQRGMRRGNLTRRVRHHRQIRILFPIRALPSVDATTDTMTYTTKVPNDAGYDPKLHAEDAIRPTTRDDKIHDDYAPIATQHKVQYDAKVTAPTYAIALSTIETTAGLRRHTQADTADTTRAVRGATPTRALYRGTGNTRADPNATTRARDAQQTQNNDADTIHDDSYSLVYKEGSPARPSTSTKYHPISNETTNPATTTPYYHKK